MQIKKIFHLKKSLNQELAEELGEYNKLNEKLNLNEKQTHSRIQKDILDTWRLSRTKLSAILVSSFKTNPSSNILFLLALAGLINVTSEYVALSNKNDQEENSQLIEQRKWTESIVDFILNIKENKHTSEAEYLSSFNFNQWLSGGELKFLFQLYKTTSSGYTAFFLSSILHTSCIKLKISHFLIKYVKTFLCTFFILILLSHKLFEYFHSNFE